MSEVSELSPERRRQFVALAGLLVVGLTLIAAELAVRTLFRYNSPDTLRENSLQYVPSTFTRHLLAPDQEIDLDAAWGLRDPSQATGRGYRIGDRGYRGEDLETQPSVDACRVAVVGGSAAFDLGADRGEDWPHLVEKILRDRGHAGVEVLNAGVPGHSSADAVGKIYAQLWLYEPDVILLYNAWNDIKTFTQLSVDRPLISLTKPHDPEADPFQNYQGFLDRLLAHSQAYVKIRTRYLLWKYDVGAEGQVKPGQTLADSWEPLALEQYRLNVELVVDAARNVGARPILATQASLLAADNSEEDRARIAYGYQGLTHDALVSAMDACNETVRAVAEHKGVDVLDLGARFSGKSEYFDDHVHTSRSGSAALAEAVADFLEEQVARGCSEASSPPTEAPASQSPAVEEVE